VPIGQALGKRLTAQQGRCETRLASNSNSRNCAFSTDRARTGQRKNPLQVTLFIRSADQPPNPFPHADCANARAGAKNPCFGLPQCARIRPLEVCDGGS
jgi:hypothetical protein